MEESTGALTELASATLDYDQYMQAQENMLLDLDNQLYEDTEQENFQLRTDPTSPEPHLPRSPPLPEHPKSLVRENTHGRPIATDNRVWQEEPPEQSSRRLRHGGIISRVPPYTDSDFLRP